MTAPVIDIYLDGKRFAMRTTWHHVPRVGDTLLLRDGEVWGEVVTVIWGDDTARDSAHLERQWVQILCMSVEPVGGKS